MSHTNPELWPQLCPTMTWVWSKFSAHAPESKRIPVFWFPTIATMCSQLVSWVDKLLHQVYYPYMYLHLQGLVGFGLWINLNFVLRIDLNVIHHTGQLLTYIASWRNQELQGWCVYLCMYVEFINVEVYILYICNSSGAFRILYKAWLHAWLRKGSVQTRWL